MLDLADAQLGQEIVVAFTAKDGLTPAWPDAAPQLVLYNGSTFLVRLEVPADPQNPVDGSFRLNLFLDARFPSAGSLHGFVQWSVDGVPFSLPVVLRIVPGGDADGTVIAMSYVRRPSVAYILWQTDAGTIFRGTNPTFTR